MIRSAQKETNNRTGIIRLLLKLYLLSVSLFFIFRLLLFATEISRLDFTHETTLNTIRAFIMGIRFDVVISGYILFLPALILLIQYILNKQSQILNKIIFYWIFALLTVSFSISAADIPYFNQFFTRFNVGAFEWMDSPVFVLKMIIGEPKYIAAIIPFIIAVYFLFKMLKKILATNTITSNTHFILKIIMSLLVLALMFAGIRGRIEKKSPIRIGTAYFCQDPFLNQLGLNPVFTFIRSIIDLSDVKNKPIDLMDGTAAIKNVQNYLHIDKPQFDSPIAHEIIPDTIGDKRYNVVFIIMESMSSAKMQRFGNKEGLTPFLDSLTYHSYFFENIYTAGEHTFNGIFSTLFSFPALYRQHSLKRIKKYNGIASVLKKLGYSTTYITTHDSQFDNIEGFLRANDFDNIISQADYPSTEVKTALGVPDDFMFRYAIPKINLLHQENKPFFVTFMTASDHGPYFIPDYFHPKNKNIKKQVTEFADWSLRRFINLAAKTKWFDNTLFVFIADHGAPMNVHYDIPLNYHHSPLLIYAPKILKPKTFSEIGGQIDVFPTIMGLLKQRYVNNTLGINLLREKRPYIFINGDDKIAALDNEFLFVLKKDNTKKLYRYKNDDKTNLLNDLPKKATEMEEYLKSNLQTFQYLLNNNLTRIEDEK